jgi:anti-anti-sigma regulatory factor
LEAFARYEHLVDRYMTSHPFSALCAYDRAELGEQTIRQLACLHPQDNMNVMFRLVASADPGAALALAGEIDLVGTEVFPLALRRTSPQARDGRVVIDASEVGFFDHRSLLALSDYAREYATTVVLRSQIGTPARIINALRLAGLSMEAVA